MADETVLEVICNGKASKPDHSIDGDFDFYSIWSGSKTFFISRTGSFEVGQTVVLRECLSKPRKYTGRRVVLEITYVTVRQDYTIWSHKILGKFN